MVELEEALDEFTPDEPEYHHALEEASVQSRDELIRKISQIHHRIQKAKQKIAAAAVAATSNNDEEEIVSFS